MQSRRLTFPGAGGDQLAGRLDLPEGTPRAYALFAHCFTCTKEALAAARIARSLAEQGIATLRFDFTGLGGSGGEFANTNFTSNVDDLVAAADFLRSTEMAPGLLVGHSLGGAAVIAAASQVPEVRAVVTIGAPAGTEHLRHLLASGTEQIEQDGEAEVCLAERTFVIRRQFLDDIADQPQQERLEELDRALLVMHSPADETVGIDNARVIFGAARHPKSFVAIDGADHLLTRRADAEFAATILAAWASRYLVEGTPTPEDAGPEGLVVVAENGEGPFGQRITVGRHTLLADEPTPTGHDTGPAPYDLLLASLGACTSMTLRMYAERKKWSLEHVEVTLRHSRIHARDCAECSTSQGRLDHIERVIGLTGDLDEDQRTRLLEIADACPVHKTLHGDVSVTTSATTP